MEATEIKRVKKRRFKRRPAPSKALILVFIVLLALLSYILVRSLTSRREAANEVPDTAIVLNTQEHTEEIREDESGNLPPLSVIRPSEIQFERGTWSERFQSNFSRTGENKTNSYKSRDISVTITKNVRGGKDPCVYYVADVYIAQIENLKTYMSPGKLGWYCKRSMKQMSNESGAILAINGDNCISSPDGLLVRNGDVFSSDEYDGDICVLYADGVMETYLSGEYDANAIIDAQPYQVWRSGVSLLDENGKAKKSFNIPSSLMWENARSAIGCYEPGHYCFVVVEGQQGSSPGLEMDKLAEIFQSLGCERAYSLPGGAYSVMYYNGAALNRLADGGRELGDIILICEID